VVPIDRGTFVGALARNVARVAAAVASLTRRVQRSAVGRGTIARDVTELATGVALHGLGLAIAGVVIGASALVAGSRASRSTESPSRVAAITTTDARSAPTETGSVRGVGAVALEDESETSRY